METEISYPGTMAVLQSTEESEVCPPCSILTLRIIMQGKEAGSIIGKKGDNVKKFREETGARINISDASCPERIVTVTGSSQQIVDAMTRICRRFEEDLQNSQQSTVITRQIVTLRLIIPACQCGSLIGKGGAKIKEIREVAGASIQISSEMLPNCTERLVTISGGVESVVRGIYHICQVMLESPAKSAIVPYRPLPAVPAATVQPTQVVLAGQPFTALHPGQYVISQPQPTTATATVLHGSGPYSSVSTPAAGSIIQYQTLATAPGLLGQAISPFTHQPTYITSTYPGGATYLPAGLIHCPPPPQQQQQQQQQQQPTVHELTIPNEQIGCIIGRAGCKINEIRQLSGANIKISGAEEGCCNRTVTISGQPESIRAAEYLIGASLELHRCMTLSQSDTTSAVPSLPALPAPPLAAPPSSNSGTPLPHPMPMSAVAPAPVNPHHQLQQPGPYGRPTVVAAGVPLSLNHCQNISTPLGFSPTASHQFVQSHWGGAVQYGSPVTYAIQVVRPGVLPVLNYDGGYIDAQCSLATKIKGGLTLAASTSFGRNGNKYSPY